MYFNEYGYLCWMHKHWKVCEIYGLLVEYEMCGHNVIVWSALGPGTLLHWEEKGETECIQGKWVKLCWVSSIGLLSQT